MYFTVYGVEYIFMEIQKKIEFSYRTDQNRAAFLILIFVVMVGIPLWWKTTDIPRATLPYQHISNIPDLQIEVQLQTFLNQR